MTQKYILNLLSLILQFVVMNCLSHTAHIQKPNFEMA